jgi:hypothetical protein
VTPDWWTGLPPVEEQVPCTDDNHRIRWCDGELTLPDHKDVDGELLLAALGGAQSPCLQIFEAWQRHRADLDLLLLASRSVADPLDRILTVVGGPGSRVASAPPGGPRGPRHGPQFPMASPRLQGLWSAYSLAPGQETLVMLLSLPGGLPIRLVATVIASWAQRIADDDPLVAAARPALYAALYGRALAALQNWLGGDVSFDIKLADVPAASRRGSRIVFELPFSWLRDVWVHGFATVAGRFCLTAQPAAAGDWIFTAVDFDCGEPAQLTLRAS